MKIDTISLILGAVAGYFLAGMMKPKPLPAAALDPSTLRSVSDLVGRDPNSVRPGVNTAS